MVGNGEKEWKEDEDGMGAETLARAERGQKGGQVRSGQEPPKV